MFKHFPRLTTVGLSYIAAFLVFLFLGPDFFHDLVVPFGLIGAFVAGMLYTYSFTASVGALLLIAIAPEYSAGTVAVVAGIGALLSDVAILRFMQNGLKREVTRIAQSFIFKKMGRVPIVKERWFRDAIGAVIIASPLPDEIGVAIVASTKIKESTFTLLAFIADMVGIYLLVSAAGVLY